jgi:hypothetical protein
MVGSYKQHRIPVPPTGQLLLSPEILAQSYHKHRLAGIRGLYWICGNTAQQPLWSKILGSIRPSFFLLPFRQGEKLGVPRYEEKLSRQKQGVLQIGNPKDNKWPPE